jgi:RsiW-degrading membrane proteinase PrsW (M82 family)
MSPGWFAPAAVLALVLSAGLYVTLLWLADPHGCEPVNHLVVTVTLGAAVVPILTRLAEAAFGLPDSIFPAALLRYVLVPLSPWTALVEEVAKSSVVLGEFVLSRRTFHDAMDGVVVGAAVGLGLAFAQSLAHVRALAAIVEITGPAPGPVLNLLVVGGLGQCVFTALFGAGLGYMRATAPRGWIYPVIGFCAAVLCHIGYVGAPAPAAAVARGAADWAGVVLVVVLMVWGRARSRRIVRDMLADEVAHGALTEDELAVFSTAPGLARPPFLLWTAKPRPHRGARAIQRAQADLAFAKWRRTRGLGSDDAVRHARDALRRTRAEQRG